MTECCKSTIAIDSGEYNEDKMKNVKKTLSRVLRKKTTKQEQPVENPESTETHPEILQDSNIQSNTPEVSEVHQTEPVQAESSSSNPEPNQEIRPVKVYKTAKQLERERQQLLQEQQQQQENQLTENTIEIITEEPQITPSSESDVAVIEKKKPRKRKRTSKKVVTANDDSTETDDNNAITHQQADTEPSAQQTQTEDQSLNTEINNETETEQNKTAKKPRRRKRAKSKKDKNLLAETNQNSSETDSLPDDSVDLDEISDIDDNDVSDDSVDMRTETAPKKRHMAADKQKKELLINAKKQHREMLINVTAGQECRIAVVQDKKLEELYVERLDTTSLVGNIYKGRIVNLEPSIQACFVDFGIGQNGFLHISDVQTSYFKNVSDHSEKVGKKQPRKDRPLIQECLRKGQEVVVQVIKAGIGTKGPTLSTYISIPGRYVVLMPGMKHSGVSRKLSQEDRQKMKELSAELSAPDDVGIILRTASLDSNKRDMKKDFNYLLRLWKQMSINIKKKTGPMELYKESDLVIRTVRDIFTNGIDKIYCDNEETWKKINEFFAIAMPRSRNMVKLYADHNPIFSRFNIEKEIEKLQCKNVPLAHGGSIVIESTEAMVTIDVNSGKYRDNNNSEDTAFKTNIEAAEEICRQLKLRDLGGVIVIDFIDMVNNNNRRELERVVRDLFLKDRASTRILRINQFGLMAITRQRMKASLKNRTYVTCPHCKGVGQIKSSESVAIEAMRKIFYAAEDPHVTELDVVVSPQIADYLLNERRHTLVEIEQKNKTRIIVKAEIGYGPEEVTFEARNSRGIRIDPWL